MQGDFSNFTLSFINQKIFIIQGGFMPFLIASLIHLKMRWTLGL